MLYVILTLATLLMVLWIVLLTLSTKEDWDAAGEARIFDNLSLLTNLRAKEKTNIEKLSTYHIKMQGVIAIFLTQPIRKKIMKLNADNEYLREGQLNSSDALIMPGYVLQRRMEAIGKSSFHKLLYTKTFELYGKKFAKCKTNQLMAKMLSYPIIGVAIVLMLGVVMFGIESASMGLGIIGIGTAMILVLVYGIYDELSDTIKKRRIAICKQFPNVISKLALLVTSGMIIDRAWKETAYSHETYLYAEMQKTSEELDNLVSPEVAYAGFITRCNTKETAKLASAIMQSRSKGNAEIGRLLKDMAREIWQERRHMAKRDAEKANSKLMIPTMLLFMAILVMLMVPIAMNFTGL